MSSTVTNKIKGIVWDEDTVEALRQTLLRYGLTEGEDFHVSTKSDHTLTDFQYRPKTYEPPVRVWIEKPAVGKVSGGKPTASNQVGFRESDGNLLIVNNQFDSGTTFTPEFVKGFTEIIKIEKIKVQARKQGYSTFVERKNKAGRPQLFVQQ